MRWTAQAQAMQEPTNIDIGYTSHICYKTVVQLTRKCVVDVHFLIVIMLERLDLIIITQQLKGRGYNLQTRTKALLLNT